MTIADSNLNSRLGSPGRIDPSKREPSPLMQQGRLTRSSTTTSSRADLRKLNEMLKEDMKPYSPNMKLKSKTSGLEHDYHFYLQRTTRDEFDRFQLRSELTPNILNLYFKWIEHQANLSLKYKVFAFPFEFLHQLTGSELYHAMNSAAYHFKDQKNNHNIEYEKFYYFFIGKDQRLNLIEFDADLKKITIFDPRDLRMTEDHLDEYLSMTKKKLNQMFNIILKEDRQYEVDILCDLPTGRDPYTANLYVIEYYKNRVFERDPRAMTSRSITATKETILNVLRKNLRPFNSENTGFFKS